MTLPLGGGEFGEGVGSIQHLQARQCTSMLTRDKVKPTMVAALLGGGHLRQVATCGGKAVLTLLACCSPGGLRLTTHGVWHVSHVRMDLSALALTTGWS